MVEFRHPLSDQGKRIRKCFSVLLLRRLLMFSSLCSESVEKNATESMSSSRVLAPLGASPLVLEVSSKSWLEEFDRDYGSLSDVFDALR